MKVEFTKELHNHLVKVSDERAKNFGLKGKGKIKMQAELFIGAMAAIDFLNGSKECCITPAVYFSILRGEELTEIK